MDSTNSSVFPAPWAAAAKAAAPAGLLAAAAGAAALLLWRGPAARSFVAGLSVAWLVSSASTAAMLASQSVSPRAFWRAFWGGMAARLAVLAGLMAMCWIIPETCAAALLPGYALGVAFLLPLEYRQVPQK